MAYLRCPHCTANNQEQDGTCFSCGQPLKNPSIEVGPVRQPGSPLWEGALSGMQVGAVTGLLAGALASFGLSALFPQMRPFDGIGLTVFSVVALLQFFHCLGLGALLGHLGGLGTRQASAMAGACLTALWSGPTGFNPIVLVVAGLYGAALGWMCYALTARRFR